MHRWTALSLVATVAVISGCGDQMVERSPVQTPASNSSRLTAIPELGPNAFRFQRTVTRQVSYPFLLWLPEGYEKGGQRWPLMMFLHGAGERGDDLKLVSVHGPAKLLSRGKKFPFIVVAPQCPKDDWWEVETLNALLDAVIAKYRVDERRVYLTGLSMGGYGTWDLAIRYPSRFAAIAPVCGGSGLGPLVCNLKDNGVPVWTFHGAKDTTVPMEETEYLVSRLKACGGDVKFTIYPDIGHNAWDPAYDDPGLYDWLLSHRRP